MALSYYADTLTTTVGEDLFDQIKVATGYNDDGEYITAKQITMISSSSFSFKVNGESWINTTYQDVDLKYKVSLTDVSISSIIPQEDAIDIFIAILF